MNATRLLTTLAVVLATVHCGPPGPDATIAIADHADALTSNPKDNLFELTVSEITEPFPAADVNVYAGLPGETATVVNFTHQDANSNGKVEQGEKLLCKEPDLNLFDGKHAGKALNVGFSVNVEGRFTTISNATWTVSN